MDREAWHAAVHGVAKNQIRLSNWSELNSKCPSGMMLYRMIQVFFRFVISLLYYIFTNFKCLEGSALSVWSAGLETWWLIDCFIQPWAYSFIHPSVKCLLSAYYMIKSCILLILRRLTDEGRRWTSKMRAMVWCNMWGEKIAHRELEPPEERLLNQCKNSAPISRGHHTHCRVSEWHFLGMFSAQSTQSAEGNWVCRRSWYLPYPQRGQYGAKKTVSVSCTLDFGLMVEQIKTTKVWASLVAQW